MHRCLHLAQQGQGRVAPNPMVGAVLVNKGRIIGEGWHRQYGGPHAEVNCVASVAPEDQHLVREATLYVSLEPCAHFGKTPPCADLVVAQQIPRVVVGCRDPFPLVAGKGIEQLQAAGVEVTLGVLEKECQQLNKRFFLFHNLHRPYITLKWAQTADGWISGKTGQRLHISNAASNRLVHRWRSEEASILVGTNTALADDPSLNTRLWPGAHPLRLVVDLHRRLPDNLKLFDGSLPTLVFNLYQHSVADAAQLRSATGGVYYYQVSEDAELVHQVVHALYQLQVQSVLVEGGAQLLQSFIDAALWDEARIITNESLVVGEGLPAPQLHQHRLLQVQSLQGDTIRYYQHS